MRIDEEDAVIRAQLCGSPGGFADGGFQHEAARVVDVAAHHVEAARGAGNKDGIGAGEEVAGFAEGCDCLQEIVHCACPLPANSRMLSIT